MQAAWNGTASKAFRCGRDRDPTPSYKPAARGSVSINTIFWSGGLNSRLLGGNLNKVGEENHAILAGEVFGPFQQIGKIFRHLGRLGPFRKMVFEGGLLNFGSFWMRQCWLSFRHCLSYSYYLAPFLYPRCEIDHGSIKKMQKFLILSGKYPFWLHVATRFSSGVISI